MRLVDAAVDLEAESLQNAGLEQASECVGESNDRFRSEELEFRLFRNTDNTPFRRITSDDSTP